jgi:hypothetical protein
MSMLFTNGSDTLKVCRRVLSGYDTPTKLLDNIGVIFEMHENYFGISK